MPNATAISPARPASSIASPAEADAAARDVHPVQRPSLRSASGAGAIAGTPQVLVVITSQPAST